MFRELTRIDKKLSTEECIHILEKEKRGVLSVSGDDGYPYGMPMNHFFNEKDGSIYFHSGKTGHRQDALKRNDKVSFCVYDSGYRNSGEWALNIKSVIVFGRVEIVEDMNSIVDIMTGLSLKFTEDMEYITSEIQSFAHETMLLKLIPEHICGKMVQES